MKTVFALIVTYNRKECLLELISSLFKQTFMPQYILIFDNFSSDGTEQALLDNNLINFDNQLDTIYCKEINNVKVLYYRNHHNSGGSGGFSSAFKLSMQFDYDYLWVMDDDVLVGRPCASAHNGRGTVAKEFYPFESFGGLRDLHYPVKASIPGLLNPVDSNRG